ncbi:MAG TPA: hypothetical protein VLA72_06760 [Anaerolineales bacterium]|nr:hypothetical protein [Anaerolineales bacterium]
MYALDKRTPLQDLVGLFELYGWNYAYYTWRADTEEWNGFNLEYGPDPNNHVLLPKNSQLSIFKMHWVQNVDFPSMDGESKTPSKANND